MIEKHSLNLRGHQTSVSLEPEFWQEFLRIADERNMTINQLASQIDESRGLETNLASAIRLNVLEDLRARLELQKDA